MPPVRGHEPEISREPPKPNFSLPSPMPPTPRGSHAKKRDASYIPRPPNAFILFRSSFIKSQRVPGNVEGNHSTLSKIIGKCWRALPREERERWEKEAVAAQAEHRRKYPDWRFRPGANAVSAKFRIKDGSASAPTSSRRRVPTRAKEKKEGDDQPMRSRTRERGKGKVKVKERSPAEEEERLAKIAELLGDGKTGRELEIAIEQWKDGRRRMSERTRADEDAPMEDSSRGSNSPTTSLPDSTEEFTKIPLTHWYKRSPSADHNEQEPGCGGQEGQQDSWWSSHITGGFNADTSGLGYASFDGDHVPRFHVPAIESPATDGSAAVDWTKTSGGYLAAVQDPFLNDKREVVVVDPVVPAAPPPIIYPREPQLPSSFSSLADWAGGMSTGEDHHRNPKPSGYDSSSSSYVGLRFYGDWDNTYG